MQPKCQIHDKRKKRKKKAGVYKKHNSTITQYYRRHHQLKAKGNSERVGLRCSCQLEVMNVCTKDTVTLEHRYNHRSTISQSSREILPGEMAKAVFPRVDCRIRRGKSIPLSLSDGRLQCLLARRGTSSLRRHGPRIENCVSLQGLPAQKAHVNVRISGAFSNEVSACFNVAKGPCPSRCWQWMGTSKYGIWK